MKIKIFFLIAIIAFATIGAAMFIYVSNDHKECKDVTREVIDENGNSVTITEHQCNESYNL